MIGSTFKAELSAAGLTCWNIAWSQSGDICYGADYPEDQKAIVEKVFAAHVYSEVAEAKRLAAIQINSKAEALCTSLITPGTTQQDRYARKLAQAEALLKDGSPTAEKYPLIYNEVGITAGDASSVAMAILANSEKFEAYCDKVEMYRMQAKQSVSLASNATLVGSILAGLQWPTT